LTYLFHVDKHAKPLKLTRRKRKPLNKQKLKKPRNGNKDRE
jgi:hypothetical protein